MLSVRLFAGFNRRVDCADSILRPPSVLGCLAKSSANIALFFELSAIIQHFSCWQGKNLLARHAFLII